MTHHKKYSPKPEDFPEYETVCETLLQTWDYTNIELLGAYVSYMSGLIYHKKAGKPVKECVYVCLPDFENKFDPNALGIHRLDTKQRLAFVPRQLAAHVKSDHRGVTGPTGPNGPLTPIQNHGQGEVVMLCFCCGHCTERSAQCFYNIYKVHRAR